MKMRLLQGRLTIDCQTDFRNYVISCRDRLCSSHWAGDIGVADTELVIIPSIRAEMLGFNLILSILKSPVTE